MVRHAIRILVPTLLLVLAVSGCDDDSTAPSLTVGEGHLVLKLIDGPGPYDAVNIEVIEVSVHRADEDSTGGWTVVSDDTLAINLLDYTNGNFAVLADSAMAAGQYTQIRLLLTDNNTVVVDGESHDLEIPSAATSGLKLNHPFTIEEGVTYGATLDFDAERSIHMTGNGVYKMNPVIRIVVDEVSGSIFGTIEPAAAQARIMTVAGDDTISSYADILTGDFRLMALPVGVYDLEITATAGAWQDTVLADVSVPAQGETDLGNIVLEEIPVP